MGTAKYCFAKYVNDIVINTKNDILNLFRDLESGFKEYDCNWKLFRKEYNYHYDGTCLKRIQEVLTDTLEESNCKMQNV